MRFLRPSRLILAAVICIVGCGGSGGGSSITNDRFAGNYQGMFYNGFSNAYGTVNITISSAGVLTGTSTQTSGGVTSTSNLTGTVQSNGSASITSGSGSGSSSTCTFSSPTAPTIEAALLNSTNFQYSYVVLAANPQAGNTATNQFAGDYAGTTLNQTTGYTGVDAWSISSTGVISGSAMIYNSGMPYLVTISGSVTPAGVVSYSVAAGSTSYGTVSGTLSLNGTALSGNLTSSTGDTVIIANSALAPVTGQ